LDFQTDPGYVLGMNMRLDFSRHSVGIIAVQFGGRTPIGELSKNGMNDKVWVAAPANGSHTLFLVFGGAAGNVLEVHLLFAFLVDKDATKKDVKKGLLAP